jgi:hypothetical protein
MQYKGGFRRHAHMQYKLPQRVSTQLMPFGAALIDARAPCFSYTHPHAHLSTKMHPLPHPYPITPIHKNAPAPTPVPFHAQALNIARTAFSAHGAEHARWRALVLATSTAGSVQHAAGEFDAAADSFESLMEMLDQQVTGRDGMGRMLWVLGRAQHALESIEEGRADCIFAGKGLKASSPGSQTGPSSPSGVGSLRNDVCVCVCV